MTEQKTFLPRTIFCHDNLPILRGINSNSIDLIYLDPPFNKGRNFHAPIGTTAEGADFKDIWTIDDVKDEWHNQINDRYPVLYHYTRPHPPKKTESCSTANKMANVLRAG